MNSMMEVVFWIILSFFGSLGLIIFWKDFFLPYVRRMRKAWTYKRAIQKMAENKPPDVRRELEHLAKGIGDIIKRDKL